MGSNLYKFGFAELVFPCRHFAGCTIFKSVLIFYNLNEAAFPNNPVVGKCSKGLAG